MNVPDFWLAPPALLPKTPGLHRFVWDLRYPDPDQLLYTYYGIHVDYFEYTLADHAIPHNTPWHEPQGPMVVPGQYEVRLTVGGTTYKQPITVKLDPRLNYSTEELQRQFDLAQKVAVSMAATYEGYNQVAKLRKELAAAGREIARYSGCGEGVGRKSKGIDRRRRAAGRARADESRPDALDDRGRSIGFASGEFRDRDVRWDVPGCSCRAGPLERSARERSGQAKCLVVEGFAGSADGAGPCARRPGLRKLTN